MLWYYSAFCSRDVNIYVTSLCFSLLHEHRQKRPNDDTSHSIPALPGLLENPWWHSTKLCFSIYFSSRNPKRSYKLTDEPLRVHNTSNIQLNTSMCFMYRTRTKSTANLKMIENLIIPPDTSTVYGELCWVTWLQSGSFWIEAAVDCVLSVTEWLVSNAITRFSIRTYEFRTASKSLPPLCISVCRNPTHPCAKPWGCTKQVEKQWR